MPPRFTPLDTQKDVEKCFPILYASFGENTIQSIT